MKIFYLIKKQFSKNIIYISNGIVKEMNHEFDLFILESESTSLLKSHV